MNNRDINIALSRIDEKYIIESCDFADLSLKFKNARKKKMRTVCTICSCFVICIAAFGMMGISIFNTNMPLLTEKDSTTNIQTTAASDKTENTTANTVVSTTVRNETTPTDNKVNQESKPPVFIPPDMDVDSINTTQPNKDATGEVQIESKYVFYMTIGPYASYQGGKVIAAEKVSEKIGDTTVTAGWKASNSSTLSKAETLRAEVFAIKNISPEIAVCIRFIDKGEAVNTEHYYVRTNPHADLSEVEDYLFDKVPSEPILE